MTGQPLYAMTDGQYQVVYDFLSFTFASMIAATIFFWLRLPSIAEKYKSAMVITGLVTFIARYVSSILMLTKLFYSNILFLSFSNHPFVFFINHLLLSYNTVTTTFVSLTHGPKPTNTDPPLQ